MNLIFKLKIYIYRDRYVQIDRQIDREIDNSNVHAIEKYLCGITDLPINLLNNAEFSTLNNLRTFRL